tara:strand:- start:18300 stop:18671 length:372 start_codon:yes stop_codon:yes gene_type:complete
MPAKVNILGRLTRDPETRETSKGTVTSFSLASNSGWGDNKTTTYFDCACFGKRGESLQKYATKGKQLWISGDLSTRSYQTRDGVDKMSLNVKVDDWHFTASGDNQAPKQARPVSTSVADEMPF